MIERRKSTSDAAAGATSSGVAPAATPTQNALVIDAMGEVREEYTDDLCREMVDSGINSITVTLCDPKSYEQQAYDWGLFNHLVPSEELESKTREICDKIIAKPPMVQWISKRIMRAALDDARILELLQPLTLLSRQAGTGAPISLSLAYPFAQRLGGAAELAGDRLNRRPL